MVQLDSHVDFFDGLLSHIVCLTKHLIMSLLDEAPFLGLPGRLSFPTLGKVPHPRSLHILFDSFLARS